MRFFWILEHILTHISFSILSIVITIYFLNFFNHEILGLQDSSKKGMIATFLSITGLLIFRWICSGHIPLSNLYESLICLSWSFLIIHSILYFKNDSKNKNYLSKIIMPSAIFTPAFATSSLSTEMHQFAILVPALQSQWLMMHVSMMLLSYVFLLFGSLFSIAFLIITFRKNIHIFSKNKNSKIQKFFFLFCPICFNYKRFKNIALFSFENYYQYQLTQKLDYCSYRMINFGFTFLTIGILSGAVWANEAWGSYWNWDPKEIWALITWIIYAMYLHTRVNQSFQGRNSAIIASIGFLIIWICYFGVNLLGMGLHSYGSFSFLVIEKKK